MTNCTLVTAFYPIKSKFAKEQYINWSKTFLRLECPIVLYTIKECVGLFENLRTNGKPLKIIEIPFEDLYTVKTYSYLWNYSHTIDPEAFRHTPELYAVWANKIDFVMKTIELNPYNTDFFFWCDIGAFRNGSVNDVILKTFPSTRYLPKDKVLFQAIEPMKKGETECTDFTYVNRLVGGLWGGGIEGCKRWHSAFFEELNLFGLCKKFAGKDQNVMISTLLRDRSLGTIVKCPYSAQNWFFLESLCSDLDIPYMLDDSYL